MRTAEECYGCLEKLILKTVSLARTDKERREKARLAGLAVLERDYPKGRIPTQIAGEAQRVIREIAGDTDPFRQVKAQEMELAARMIPLVRRRFSGDLPGLLKVAVLGNAVDFFKDSDTVAVEMMAPVEFYLDQTAEFIKRLADCRRILYLADNASECYFDLGLVQELEKYAETYYTIKGSAVQNDLTMFELDQAGLTGKMKNIVTTETDTPGLDMELVPAGFSELFYGVDLILAKGMGYYETLPEIEGRPPVFHVLMAKCAPVARSLGVPQNSYVATFC
ncbi:MAG: ARMT1-like domain-containing protein [Clostridia bacterium]|nr:ARMT1-like domain-containing protein [Clostridia bacterium]MDQ7792363.1 ARMT1-like domain-containing protein [Clostridia bacterium]